MSASSLNNLTKKYDFIILINSLNETADYDTLINKSLRNLKKNGILVATLSSIANNEDSLWGFTKASAKVIFNKYYSSKNIKITVFGSALAGRLLLEKKSLTKDLIKKLDTANDEHFPVMIGVVGKNHTAKQTNTKRLVNILVDEEKGSTLRGSVATVLKRSAYFLDKPIYFARSLRGVAIRFLRPKEAYLQDYLTTPISKNYGFERGKPIDRYYIESFLNQNRNYIKGRCLEIVDNTYTKKYGQNRVTTSDVLDIFPSKKANITGDLRNLTNVRSNTYDCLIITQTFNVIDDYVASIKESFRILKPGGCLIATLPTLSPAWNIQINFWRFSVQSAKFIFGSIFGPNQVSTKSYGNPKSTLGFWLGMSQEDLKSDDISHNDTKHPLIVGIIAKK